LKNLLKNIPTYQPQIGDFGVVRTKGIVGRLIQIFTVSRWNHAFVYVGTNTIVEATPRGVKLSPISNYENIAWSQHDSLSEDTRAKIADHAKKQVGKPYNFLLIGNILLRIIGLKLLANTRLMYKLAKSNSYICSELVSESYKEAGVNYFNMPPNLVTPGDLAELLVYL
jgi:uncharacterized protein YycO